MAGVLEQIRRPRRQLIGCASMPGVSPKVLELQAAKEILAEVFGLRASEVDEMLKHRYNEVEVWPMEFCLEKVKASSNIRLIPMRLVHGLYSSDSMLEDKNLPFSGLDQEFIGII